MSIETASRPPRVWVVYKDSRKDMSKAEKFGQLTEMFSGRYDYKKVVEQARRMMDDYRDGDYVLMIGDPALCAVVASVAIECSDSGVIQLLRWDRDEVDYQPVPLDFTYEDLDEPRMEEPPAEVFTQNRYGSR